MASITQQQPDGLRPEIPAAPPAVLLVGPKSCRLRTFADLLSCRLGAFPLPPSSVGERRWAAKLETKYYSAEIHFVELQLSEETEKQEEAQRLLRELEGRVEALIQFDDDMLQDGGTASYEQRLGKTLNLLADGLTNAVESAKNQEPSLDPLPRISVKLLVLEATESTDWLGVKYSSLFDWSYDRGIELVETTRPAPEQGALLNLPAGCTCGSRGCSIVSTDVVKPTGATLAAAGTEVGTKFPLLSAEGEPGAASLDRVVEALECHIWPNMERKPKIAPKAVSPEVGNFSEKQNVVVDKDRERGSAKDDIGGSEDKMNVEGFERLMAQMTDFRLNQVKNLSDEERRERASELILKLSALMGD